MEAACDAVEEKRPLGILRISVSRDQGGSDPAHSCDIGADGVLFADF